MEFSDVIELVGIYLGAFTGIFVIAFGAWGIWTFFKDLASPDFNPE